MGNSGFEQSGARDLNVDLDSINYSGIDISDLMRRAAVESHPEYGVEVFPDTSRFLDSEDAAKSTKSALFDLNVSSYVFSTSETLAKFLNLFDVAYVLLALTKGETVVSSVGSKSFVYFSLEELTSFLEKPLFFLCDRRTGEKPWLNSWTSSERWLEPSLGRPGEFGFFVCGEPDRVRSLVAGARAHPDVSEYFEVRQVDLVDTGKVLSGQRL